MVIFMKNVLLNMLMESSSEANLDGLLNQFTDLFSFLTAITKGIIQISKNGITSNKSHGLAKLILFTTVHHPIRYIYYS